MLGVVADERVVGRRHVGDAHGWWHRLTLPHDEHAPAQLVKQRGAHLVAPTVAFELWSPVLWFGSRQLAAICAVMTMPEAAVNKNHLAMASQHHVGAAGQLRLMQPIAVPHGMDEPSDDHLGLGVCLADALHPLGQAESFLLHTSSSLSPLLNAILSCFVLIHLRAGRWRRTTRGSLDHDRQPLPLPRAPRGGNAAGAAARCGDEPLGARAIRRRPP